MWGWGDEVIKSIKKFQNYRHMLSTDSCGGGGSDADGGGVRKNIKYGKYRGISKL